VTALRRVMIENGAGDRAGGGTAEMPGDRADAAASIESVSAPASLRMMPR